jgi:hypothetical protein
MNPVRDLALVLGMAIGVAGTASAQSTLSGVFLTGVGEGAIGGNIHLTLNGDQVHFQSTLFQYWTDGTSLEPVWQLQDLEVSFGLGAGTPGAWQLGDFLGPIPGLNPDPPRGELIDPGFALPVYFDGVRFSGAFAAPAGLEDALLAGGGVVQLQIRGTVNLGGSPIQDPRLSAVLTPVPESSATVLLLCAAVFFVGWQGTNHSKELS